MTKKKEEKSLKDAWAFFRQWIKNPLAMAAVSPSSRELAQKMLEQLPPGSRKVIELGAGTGVFTQALLDHGISPCDLLVLELNQSLYQYLLSRFPEINIACADARDAEKVTRDYRFAEPKSVDAVISGLGMLSMGQSMQQEILSAAFAMLAPHGRFIQFTYGPKNPVKPEVMRQLELKSHRAGFTLWNVPPATVYVLSKLKSKRIHATKADSSGRG